MAVSAGNSDTDRTRDPLILSPDTGGRRGWRVSACFAVLPPSNGDAAAERGPDRGRPERNPVAPSSAADPQRRDSASGPGTARRRQGSGNEPGNRKTPVSSSRESRPPDEPRPGVPGPEVCQGSVGRTRRTGGISRIRPDGPRAAESQGPRRVSRGQVVPGQGPGAAGRGKSGGAATPADAGSGAQGRV